MEDHKPVEKEFHYQKLQEIIKAVEAENSEKEKEKQTPLIENQHIITKDYFLYLPYALLGGILIASFLNYFYNASLIYFVPLVLATLWMLALKNKPELFNSLSEGDTPKYIFISFLLAILSWAIAPLVVESPNILSSLILAIAVVAIPIYVTLKYLIVE